MRAFLRHLRGTLVFAGFAVNTIFWSLPLFVLALLKLLVPIAGVRTFVTCFGKSWV